MLAPTDNTTDFRPEQTADPTHPRGGNLVSIWARGRRRMTPWAYPHLPALAATRFAIGIFLTGLGAVMVSRGYAGLAAVPLAGAALHFSIACLDIAVVRSAPPRT